MQVLTNLVAIAHLGREVSIDVEQAIDTHRQFVFDNDLVDSEE
jgi:hypothetical protein